MDLLGFVKKYRKCPYVLITKKIVEEHGGDIEVWSEFGKGSIFKIKFPVN